MRFKLRLNASNDFDLITLAQIKQFDFSGTLVMVLKAYVKNGVLISVPVPSLTTPVHLHSMEISFSLHEERDAEVLGWLNRIRKGQRSGAIKRILVKSLDRPFLDAYFTTGDAASNVLEPMKDVPASVKAATNGKPKSSNRATKQIQPAPSAKPGKSIYDPDFFDWS